MSTSTSSSSDPKGRGSSNCIYVTNLDLKVKESDLEDLFSKKGKVFSCQINRDRNGVSRGYAFIRMQYDADTQPAINEFNQYNLLGKPLIVELSRSKEGPPSHFHSRADRDYKRNSPPPRGRSSYNDPPPSRSYREDHRIDGRGAPPSSYRDGGVSRPPPPARFDPPGSYDSQSSRNRAPEYKRSLPEPISDRYSVKQDRRYPNQPNYPEDTYSRGDSGKQYSAPPTSRDTRGYPDQSKDTSQRSEYSYSDTSRRPPPPPPSVDSRLDPPPRQYDSNGPRGSGYEPPGVNRDRGYARPPTSEPPPYSSSYRSEPTDLRPPRSGWDDTGRRDPPPNTNSYGRNDYTDRSASYAPEYPSRTYDPTSYPDRGAPSQNPSASGYPDYRSESYGSASQPTPHYSYPPSQSQAPPSLSASDLHSALKSLTQATNTFSTSSTSQLPTNDTYSYPAPSSSDSYRPYAPPSSYNDRDLGRNYRGPPPSSSAPPPSKIPQDHLSYSSSSGSRGVSDLPGAYSSSGRSYSSVTGSSSSGLHPGGSASSSYPPSNAASSNYPPPPSGSGGGGGQYGYVRSEIPKPSGRYEPYRQ